MNSQQPFKWRHFESEIILLLAQGNAPTTLVAPESSILGASLMLGGAGSLVEVRENRYLYRAIGSKENTLNFLWGSERLRSLLVNLLFSSLIHLYRGNDELYGENGTDELFGGGGDDYLSGGSNDDYIEGENNNDILR